MNRHLQVRQRRYYAETAERYDELHLLPGDEHYTALKYVSSLAAQLEVSSILDVGSGTGRALGYLLTKGFTTVGVEPVPAMIEQAITRNGIGRNMLITGSGDALPFTDRSFDVACAFGVLHHVQTPDKVLGEMLRVARRAVFLSDENRFGMGSLPARLLKLFLYKAGIFRPMYYLKTFGKGYRYSDDDGIAYSYSVYDAYDRLAEWADRIILIPTAKLTQKHWLHPLLNSTHVLLCAIRE